MIPRSLYDRILLWEERSAQSAAKMIENGGDVFTWNRGRLFNGNQADAQFLVYLRGDLFQLAGAQFGGVFDEDRWRDDEGVCHICTIAMSMCEEHSPKGLRLCDVCGAGGQDQWKSWERRFIVCICKGSMALART